MIFNDFNGKKLPLLGFGAMRLPLLGNEKDSPVDIALTEKMVEYAMKNGVNYFDTAYSYHSGNSEGIIGSVLKKYPRESFYLATKYPGHQIINNFERYNPQAVFEEQLSRCRVEYFDFYLLHNVCEKSMDIYTDESYGVIEYFKEQKRKGRIKHLGFSTHARPEALRAFLDLYGNDMEFCQIQLNYLDWTLQSADEKYEMLKERGIPVFVMEPVRGGKLAKLPGLLGNRLREIRPDSSEASWCFRWLERLDNVKLILSGMSNMEQVIDNVRTLEKPDPVSDKEEAILFDIAERLKASVPCTACGYCTVSCPAGLDIPTLVSTYNQLKFSPSVNVSMLLEFSPEDKLPSACINCGKCTKVCPQNIDVPKIMRELDEMLKKLPKWADVCREREKKA